MKVNIKKTKVLIFNKAGKKIVENFRFQENFLECVSNYRYLGVHFTASGSFNIMRNELYKKALKAYFKLRSDFFSLNPSIKTCLHIFDHTLKPILLFNSEVWGSYCASNAKMRTFDFENIFKNVSCEKLHIRFLKQLLGVHRKSVNFAVLSELGRFPLYYDIAKSVIKYWYRFENLSSDHPILKDAYICSKNLNNEGKHSWYTFVSKLLNHLDIKNDFLLYSKYKFKKITVTNLREKLLKNWYLLRSKYLDGKLCTYLNIKDHFGYENYLSKLSNFEIRKTICRFRISAHRLQIEVGRFSNISRSERICKNCSSGKVEDEEHFLCECSKYESTRSELFKSITDKYPNFAHIDNKSKLTFLLSNEDSNILTLTSKFIKYNMTN